MEPVHYNAGEGIRRSARGNEMTFKAIAATIDGRFSLMERTLPPGGRMPPAHRHGGTEEAFFVLDGVVHFYVGDDSFEGGEGSFVLVPAGVAHTFGNDSEEEARLLVLHAPALDDYFRDLEALWSNEAQPTPEAEMDLMRQHGMEPA